MKENYTHITYLLDRSGSMQALWSDVVGGYQALIEEHQACAGECSFTLVGFDCAYEKAIDVAPLASVDGGNLPFAPRASTALLDALGRSIVETGQSLAAMDESERPDKVLFIVQTDGLENSSEEYTLAQVRDMVRHQREVYQWDFMFLGAGEDAIAAQGVQAGIPQTSSASYSHQSTKRAMRSASRKSRRYRESERIAKEQALEYTAQEREDLQTPDTEE